MRVPVVTLAWLLALAPAAAALADEAPPQGVVGLSASASTDIAKDWISVTLATQREGADAGPVQSALKQALDSALQQARAVEKPGQVELRGGNFSLSPRYTGKGQTNGWQGRTELIVEGRDMATIAQLTGRITTLSIAQVSYGLSREQRQQAEADVTARAIANYRQRAADVAKAFGYSGYVIRQVDLSSNQPPFEVQPMRMKMMSAPGAADEALPVEAGKATVSVTVNGSVQLLK